MIKKQTVFFQFKSVFSVITVLLKENQKSEGKQLLRYFLFPEQLCLLLSFSCSYCFYLYISSALKSARKYQKFKVGCLIVVSEINYMLLLLFFDWMSAHF